MEAALPASAAASTEASALALAGTRYVFVWNAQADVIKNDNVAFRLRLEQKYRHSPVLRTGLGSQTRSFRLAASWYINVVDEARNALAAATVYANGEVLGKTDQAGLLKPTMPITQPLALVAFAEQFRQPATRRVHGWVYQVQNTSLHWDADGNAQPFTATEWGQQRLVVRKTHPLILFNIVVSIEWQADSDYVQRLATALHRASDYLLDSSDGQMAFGNVTIYNNKQYWEDADIQIAAANTIHPHTYVGGIFSANPAHAIHLGRTWDGISGNQGSWDEPNGYRTIIHEFGHYGLALYDEYFGYRLDASGNFIGRISTNCTSPANRNPATDASNASIMDHQYTASELSDRGLPGLLWSSGCEQTAHYQLSKLLRGQGESTWETIARTYADATVPPRWLIVTPAQTQQVTAGPLDLPTQLPDWPTLRLVGLIPQGTPYYLSVLDPVGQPFADALVALVKADGVTIIEQGRTSNNGTLEIYGAVSGDIVRASSIEGSLIGKALIGVDQYITLTLAAVNAQSSLAATIDTADLAFLTQPVSRQQLLPTGKSETIYALDGNLALDLNLPGATSAAQAINISHLRTLPALLPAELHLLAGPYLLSTEDDGAKQMPPAFVTIRHATAIPALVTPVDSVLIYRWNAAMAQWEALVTSYTSDQSTASALMQESGVYILASLREVSDETLLQRFYLPLITR